MTQRTIMRPRERHPEVERAPATIDWAAAGWAGLAAGILFIVVQTALISLFTGGPNADAVRQIAAISLGEAVLPSPTPFTVLVFLAAMTVHLTLPLVYARLLAALVRGRTLATACAAGAVYGVFLYLVNYYVFTGILPWFAASRGWITAVSHVVFGVTAAAAYILISEHRRATSRP